MVGLVSALLVLHDVVSDGSSFCLCFYDFARYKMVHGIILIA